ncbi:MAG: SusF/SusE family outer membrane protein [Bacteroidaceae bacterium]|nr:SusF/SusE family outer membrane protein [Bacteroidaceae bacterium]
MKKLNYIISGVMGLALLVGCQEHPMTTINPAATEGTLSFEINTPAYAGYTYVLSEAKGAETMETIYVREQPDYGFTAATQYYAQVSFGETFEEATFVELESVGSRQTYPINTKDMNKAITLLQGDNVNENPGVMDIYVRLRAHLSDATPSVTESVPTIKDCYSNVIKLSIQPYYMLLVDALPQPYWLVGDFNSWSNSADGAAAGLVPMSLVDGFSYNTVTGAGDFTFTGYFEAGLGYKLVLVPGSWDIQVGSDGTNLVFNDGGSGNITVAESGYYTLTANSEKFEGKFEAADITPNEYTSMEFVGSFDNWGEAPIMMTPMNMKHLWYATMTFDADYEGKFRANSAWDNNWGGDSFPYSTVKSGNNIQIKAGTYEVVFNDIDGNYYFFAK